MAEANTCPICNTSADVKENGRFFDVTVKCRRCGDFSMARAAKDDFATACAQVDTVGILEAAATPTRGQPIYRVVKAIAERQGPETSRAIISHVLKKSPRTRGRIISLILDDIADILISTPMPTPAEQANNLIMLMAVRQPSIGHAATIDDSDYGLLGLQILPPPHDVECIQFLRVSLKEQGFITEKHPGQYALSLKGWQKYEELKRSVEGSKKAFVAMEFPDDEKRAKGRDYFFQDTLLDKHLVPAVKLTGFELGNPLRSNPQAGNMHARLEVEIRAARFVVAELSDENNGAYWEAGFARGLGKPVIYMCRKNAPRHFDVGSDYIVMWEKDKPEKAADELKDIVRATLFSEAIMTDT